MTKKLKKETVNIHDLSGPQRDAFFDELYAIYAEIFDGYSRRELQRNFEADDLFASVIQVMRDHSGEIVGFNAVRVSSYEIRGAWRDVFRSIAGMKPEYRGGYSTIMFGIQTAATHKLRHPLRKVYYFGNLLHPSSYYLMSRVAHEFWPRYDRETPWEIHQLITEFAKARGYECDDPSTPYAALANEVTRQAAVESGFWKNSDHPAVRFFIQSNPRYEQGYGLMTLIPLTWSNLGAGFAQYLYRRTRRALSGHRKKSATQ